MFEIYSFYSLGSYQWVREEFRDNETQKYVIDFETSVRAVSFLSNNFAKLERVYFGGTTLVGQLRPFVSRDGIGRNMWFTDRDLFRTMSALIDSLSAAF
jgi:hypothetical protein